MAEVYGLWLVTSVAMGISAAAIAKFKNRNPLAWFFIGFATNLFVLAIIALAKNRQVKNQK
jgi:hypothetical protein